MYVCDVCTGEHAIILYLILLRQGLQAPVILLSPSHSLSAGDAGGSGQDVWLFTQVMGILT